MYAACPCLNVQFTPPLPPPSPPPLCDPDYHPLYVGQQGISIVLFLHHPIYSFIDFAPTRLTPN